MIINTKLALEKSNGSTELAKELFTMLIKDLPQALEKIKASYQANSLQELSEHTHRLYGSTTYCGVPDLKSAAAKLDSCVKNNNENEISNHIQSVEKSIHELLNNATQILNRPWS